MQDNLSHLHNLHDWNLPQAAFEYSMDTPPGMQALARGVPGLREITSCHATSGIHTTKGPLFCQALYVQGCTKRWDPGCVNSCPAARGCQEVKITQPGAYLLVGPTFQWSPVALLYHIPVISDSVLTDSIPSYIRFCYISFHFLCSIRFSHQIWGYI